MKKYFFFVMLTSLLLFSCKPASEPDSDLTRYVNPFIGTDIDGNTFPGAIVPFGMVQVSPDTRYTGWSAPSHYHYLDSIIYGFSHTHLSGTGIPDYGDILLMPFAGQHSIINTEYGSRYSHDQEVATPGYYSVLLQKNNIKVELTLSKRVGMQRYHFPENSGEKGVILDLKHKDIVLYSSLEFDAANNSVSGIRNSFGWSSNQKLSFSILFSQPIQKIEYYVDDVLVEKGAKIEGLNCKAAIFFADDVKEVITKTAISSNTEEPLAAMKNQIEIDGFDFDKVREDAKTTWNNELGKIRVEGKDAGQKTNFYTALYHTFTAPDLFTDVDGKYLGQDGKMHQAEGNDVYTVFSLWDTYRALHPLLNIIDRKRSADFLYTFTKHYEQGGMLPVWELSAWETWCMPGYHSVPVIYDAYVKGMANYDTNKMLEAMIYSATLNKYGRPEFAKYGYIPAEMEGESVSKIMEYSYDDWCIAQFAKATGNEAAYKEFNERSQYYKNILDPNGFAHPKINGGFTEPFDPMEANAHFTEANSWQYSTYVPHDMTTYIERLGGMKAAAEHFDSLFHSSSQITGNGLDIHGMVGQYAHGNEPSHHASYLYNYVAQPWKTQEIVRQIMKELYAPNPGGICGNDDCGQISAWYVMSAMGFYPVCPGSNQYVIGSPIFDEVTINLENGKQVVIICKNQSDKNIYIRSAKLNGENYTKSYITYNDIKDGLTLELVMGDKPNTRWGVAPEDIPFSKVENTITTVPYIYPAAQTFSNEQDVHIVLFEPAKKDDASVIYPAQSDVIYYTLDGSEPTKESTLYSQPVKINSDTELKAVAYNDKTGYSKVVTTRFVKFEKDKKILSQTKYNRSHNAGGDEGLIDGIRGTNHFSMGWQGFKSRDFEAVVDLGSVRDVKEIGAGFLQDISPWIWFPTSLIVEISDDNVNYKPYGTYNNPYSPKDRTVMAKDFTIKKAAKTRYVKLTAKNIGKVPEWHEAPGEDAHLFVDEIIVR